MDRTVSSAFGTNLCASILRLIRHLQCRGQVYWAIGVPRILRVGSIKYVQLARISGGQGVEVAGEVH